MYGSHDMRHTGIRRLTVVIGTPGFWGVTGSKDTVPKKRRGKNQESTPEEPGTVITSKELNALEEAQTHEKITNPRNTENSITYCNEIWDRNKIIFDDIFAFSVAHKIMDNLLLNAVKGKIGLSGRKQLRLN